MNSVEIAGMMLCRKGAVASFANALRTPRAPKAFQREPAMPNFVKSAECGFATEADACARTTSARRARTLSTALLSLLLTQEDGSAAG